jgi:hypothetical protein
MDKSEIDAFRLGFRLELLERLVLRTALLTPVLSHHLSIEQSQMALAEWLDTNSETADRTYGAYFHDPAKSALYADEVKGADRQDEINSRQACRGAKRNWLMTNASPTGAHKQTRAGSHRVRTTHTPLAICLLGEISPKKVFH